VPQYEVLDPYQCEPAVFHIVNTTDPSMSQYVYWVVDNDQVFVNQDTITTDSLWNGVYDMQMVVTSYQGCVDSTTFVGALEVNAETIANFQFSPNPVTMFNAGVQFNNFSVNGDSFQWTFEHGSPSASTNVDPFVDFPDGVSGTYEVMLISFSDMGCIDTLIRTITVYPEVLIYAPNSFTPDDDARNDTWRVWMEGVDVMDFELFIFNRWGEVIWESHDMEVGWDGTYNGKPAQEGTYTWTVEAKNRLNDERMKYNGHINILR
jgi:gliding motility-associated-like protein